MYMLVVRFRTARAGCSQRCPATGESPYHQRLPSADIVSKGTILVTILIFPARILGRFLTSNSDGGEQLFLWVFAGGGPSLVGVPWCSGLPPPRGLFLLTRTRVDLHATELSKLDYGVCLEETSNGGGRTVIDALNGGIRAVAVSGRLWSIQMVFPTRHRVWCVEQRVWHSI